VIPLLGFTPDLDPTTPGCILECDEIIPSDIGMKAAPASASVGLAALSAACKGAATLRNLSGTRRLIAGTGTRLYESNSTAWTDVSSATYNLGADDRWSFCQFGDAGLAAAITDTIQRSTSGTFTSIAGAPKAEIIDSVLGFVMALHTNESTYGDSPDRWWCSALYDETSWTANVSTQATTGRLIEGAGKFTAGARLGDDFIAYKQRALFLGRYSGAPEVWHWTQISSEIGCVGKTALANTGVMHLFVGEDDIYLYDGVRPQSIADGQVRRWFTTNRDPAYAYRTQVLWDRQNSLAYFFFASTTSAGVIDQGLVYHTKRQRWGLITRNIEAVVNYVSPAITYDAGSPLVTTYDAGPTIPFDSPFWVSASETPAVFETDHIVKTLSGTPGTSTFTTGDWGDEDQETSVDQVKLRFKQSPTSATCTGYVKAELGATMVTASATATLDDGGFDLRQTDQWHRFAFSVVGSTEFSAIRPHLIPAGRRRA
jgi:hypothetical protein